MIALNFERVDGAVSRNYVGVSPNRANRGGPIRSANALQ